MKRCLSVTALLLGVYLCLGTASADYIVVKIDLNAVLHPPQPFAGAQPGNPGTISPQPGVIMPPPPGPVYTPPKGAMPGKGGKSAGGKGGAGFPKQQPIPVQPQPQPYPVQPGVIGQPPGAAGQPGSAVAPAPVSTEPPMYVYAYLEVNTPVRTQPKSALLPFNLVTFDHRLGDLKASLYLREQDRKILQGVSPQLAFNAEFAKLKSDLKKNPDDSKKSEAVFLAKRALQHGLLPEFEKCISELKVHDPKHPVVIGVEKTRAQLNQPPTADDPAAKVIVDNLKSQGYEQFVPKEVAPSKTTKTEKAKPEGFVPLVAKERTHYTLLTNMSQSDNNADLLKKLERLEQIYATFFYWFAVSEQARAMPPYRMVVVVAEAPSKSPAEFIAKLKSFDFPPMVGSGFTVQRENVIFMASRRLDRVYEELLRYNEAQWVINKTSMNQLLTQLPTLLNTMASQKDPNVKDLPVLQGLALCQKAMDDENDLVTLSHQGMRQLIAATGVLPPNMQTAEWARFGLASLFEIPPEAVYPTLAGPNWAHLTNFKAMCHEQKLEAKDAKDVLLRTISDIYLHHAYNTLKISQTAKEDQASWTAQAELELEWARATAWSVMYYLAGEHEKDLKRTERQKKLQRYFDEINGLPRDADFDPRVLQDCFFRAFGLQKSDPDNPDIKIPDEVKLSALAVDWFNSIEKLRLPVAGYEKLMADMKNPTHTPPQPAVTQPGVGSGFVQPGTGIPPNQGVPKQGIPPGQKKGKGG